MLLYQTFAYTIHEKYKKKSSNNDNVKKSAPSWNVEFELLAGSYSASDIPEYFKYFLKNRKKRLEKRILCETIKLCAKNVLKMR